MSAMPAFALAAARVEGKAEWISIALNGYRLLFYRHTHCAPGDLSADWRYVTVSQALFSLYLSRHMATKVCRPQPPAARATQYVVRSRRRPWLRGWRARAAPATAATPLPRSRSSLRRLTLLDRTSRSSCRSPRCGLLSRLRHQVHTRALPAAGTDAARRQQQRTLAIQRLLIHDQPEQLRRNATLLADCLAEPLHGPSERDAAERCARPRDLHDLQHHRELRQHRPRGRAEGIELDRLLGIGAVVGAVVGADEVDVGAEGLLLEPRVGAVAVWVEPDAGAGLDRVVVEAALSRVLFRRLRRAAWSRSNRAISWASFCSAISSAVLPAKPRSEASAPSSSNALAAAVLPWPAVQCSGVRPSWSCASSSATCVPPSARTSST